MKRIAAFSGLLMFLCTACTVDPGAVFVKSSGDPCEVAVHDSRDRIPGELLAADDSCLYLRAGRRVFRVPYSGIDRVSIPGYSNAGSKFFGNAIPGAILLVLGYSLFRSGESRNTIPVLALAGMFVLNITATLSNNPQVDFRPPWPQAELDRLRLFARYPAGLTPAQWKELLTLNGLNEFDDIRGKRE